MTGFMLGLIALINSHYGYSVCEINEKNIHHTIEYIWLGKQVECGVITFMEGVVVEDLGQTIVVYGTKHTGINDPSQLNNGDTCIIGKWEELCSIGVYREELKSDCYIK